MNNADAWAPIPEDLAQQAWCDAQDSAFSDKHPKAYGCQCFACQSHFGHLWGSSSPLNYTCLDL